MTPQSLNIKGSTQPEVFQGTVDGMAGALHADAARFWQDTLNQNGPIEVWEIHGERFLYNGSHRYHAAIRAGADIPDWFVQIVNKSVATVPTFPLDQLDWLPGIK